MTGTHSMLHLYGPLKLMHTKLPHMVTLSQLVVNKCLKNKNFREIMLDKTNQIETLRNQKKTEQEPRK